MDVQLKLYFFTSFSCGVCSSILPKLEALVSQKFPQISLESILVDDQPKLAADFGVFTVPVLLLTIDGKQSQRWVRNFGLAEVEQKLSRIITLTS